MTTPNDAHADGPRGGVSADVSVRVAWADDAPAIGEVQVRAWREQYDGLLPADLLETMQAQEFAAAWRKSLNHPQDARNRVLVALERSSVRGFAVTGPAADPDLNPISDGEIAELTVDPPQTRRGHGSRLVQACADTMRADKFTHAVTWITSTEDVLRGFLTEAGWAADGAHRELDLHGDGEVRVRQVRLHTDLTSA